MSEDRKEEVKKLMDYANELESYIIFKVHNLRSLFDTIVAIAVITISTISIITGVTYNFSFEWWLLTIIMYLTFIVFIILLVNEGLGTFSKKSIHYSQIIIKLKKIKFTLLFNDNAYLLQIRKELDNIRNELEL